MKKTAAFIFLLLIACTDSTSTSLEEADSRVTIAIDVFIPDVQIVEIPDVTVDALEYACAILNGDNASSPATVDVEAAELSVIAFA